MTKIAAKVHDRVVLAWAREDVKTATARQADIPFQRVAHRVLVAAETPTLGGIALGDAPKLSADVRAILRVLHSLSSAPTAKDYGDVARRLEAFAHSLDDSSAHDDLVRLVETLLPAYRERAGKKT
jgi:hypothetical protein